MTTADGAKDFTEQEFQVIFALCGGLRNKEIAQQCGIAAEEIVQQTMGSIYDKAAVSSRMELLYFARAALNAYLRRSSGR